MDTSNNDDASNEHTLSLFDIETLPGNSSCVDCNVGEAEWASLGFGVLICLNCAGHHRSLGVHISLVRSLNLDSWSTTQLSCLRHGGNDNFRTHLSTCFASSSSSSGSRSESQRDVFESRYSNPEVLYYKYVSFYDTSIYYCFK
jgi:Putative GTPase activating protein for Arf